MGQVINIGDMVELSQYMKKSCKKTAIFAWERINLHESHEAKYFQTYSGNIPADSSKYNDWTDSLINSAAIVIDNKVDDVFIKDWVKVRFMCFDYTFWTKTKYLKKCK